MAVDRKAVVQSVLRHEDTTLCPYTIGYDAESSIPEHLDDYYGSKKWRNVVRNYISVCGDLQDGRTAADWSVGVLMDHYGTVWQTDKRPFHIAEPALKSSSLRGFSLPDSEMFFPESWEREVETAIADNSDCFTVLCMGPGLFERTWMIRGFMETLTEMAAESTFVADLMAGVAEHQEILLDRFLSFPIAGIFFGDDWCDQRGCMLGPERWREMVKPLLARLYAKAKSAGKIVLQHCCGSVTPLIPDLIEIGLDVLQSVQPEAADMSPYELKDKFGDRLSFWGGLGSQHIIPFGSPEELRQEIRKLADYMCKGGGYIASPSKDLQPETPTENAAAIIEEFVALGGEAQMSVLT